MEYWTKLLTSTQEPGEKESVESIKHDKFRTMENAKQDFIEKKKQGLAFVDTNKPGVFHTEVQLSTLDGERSYELIQEFAGTTNNPPA